MADFGDTYDKRVNSTQAKVRITYASVTSELMLLQDMSEVNGGTEYREPTTSAGPAYYSGQPNNKLTGTVLFSTDAWKNTSNNLNILNTRVNGEKPVFKITVTYTDVRGTPVSDVFTWDPASGNSGAKLESLTKQKSAEGAVKYSISIVLIGDPVVT